MISTGTQDGYVTGPATNTDLYRLGISQEWNIKSRNSVQSEPQNSDRAGQANLDIIKATGDDEEGSMLLNDPSDVSSSSSLSGFAETHVGFANADSSLPTTNASPGSSQLTIQKPGNDSSCDKCKEGSSHPGIISGHPLAELILLESEEGSLHTLAYFPSNQEGLLNQRDQFNGFLFQD